jgi:type III secretion system low calcium response chaperone LcrH/SycD
MTTAASTKTSQLADDAQTLLHWLGRGGTLAQALGLPARELEALYALGLGLYRQGRLDDALKVFAWLVQMDHGQGHWLHALAATLQRQGRHARALQYWGLAQWLNLADPDPTYHSAHSLLALGHLQDAATALRLVLQQCQGRADRALLARRAQGLLQVLQARLPTPAQP